MAQPQFLGAEIRQFFRGGLPVRLADHQIKLSCEISGLQGISIIGPQRWARINYVGFGEGEARKVQVGANRVEVKCRKIGADFVEVQVLPDEKGIILKKESGRSEAQRKPEAGT